MASITTTTTRNGDRPYRVRCRDPGGSTREKWFKRETDAKRFAATTEADQARGVYVDLRLGDVTLAEFANRWLSTTVHLKPKTREGYESLLRNHIFSQRLVVFR